MTEQKTEVPPEAKTGKKTTMADQLRIMKEQAKRPLSLSELQTIQEEKTSAEQILKDANTDAGVGTAAEGAINKFEIKSQIDVLQRLLDTSTPATLTDTQKDALAKREKWLEDKLKLGIPTRYEMDKPHKCPGAVRKHMSWLDRNNRMIEEYRDIQRLLRPGEEKSVEQLRKDR